MNIFGHVLFEPCTTSVEKALNMFFSFFYVIMFLFTRLPHAPAPGHTGQRLPADVAVLGRQPGDPDIISWTVQAAKGFGGQPSEGRELELTLELRERTLAKLPMGWVGKCPRETTAAFYLLKGGKWGKFFNGDFLLREKTCANLWRETTCAELPRRLMKGETWEETSSKGS